MAVFFDKFHRLQFVSITWGNNFNKLCFGRTKYFRQKPKKSGYWIRIMLRNFEATFTNRYTFQAAFIRIVTPRASFTLRIQLKNYISSLMLLLRLSWFLFCTFTLLYLNKNFTRHCVVWFLLFLQFKLITGQEVTL